MALQNLRKKNQGFTLVELMIVVAIIGILAAIAIPQFAAYRIRSFNANAKALNKTAVGAESDLNAELGVFGDTERLANTLIAAKAVLGVANGLVSFSGNVATANFTTAATAAQMGGRLAGINNVSNKMFNVPLGIGADMALLANTSTADALGGITVASNAGSYLVFSKHLKGDTAYGSDSDAPGSLYSVSNPQWVGNTTVDGLEATRLGAFFGQNDFDIDNVPISGDEMPGAGLPSANWASAN